MHSLGYIKEYSQLRHYYAIKVLINQRSTAVRCTAVTVCSTKLTTMH